MRPRVCRRFTPGRKRDKRENYRVHKSAALSRYYFIRIRTVASVKYIAIARAEQNTLIAVTAVIASRAVLRTKT